MLTRSLSTSSTQPAGLRRRRKPYWSVSGPGVRFNVPKLPTIPTQNLERALKKGMKIEKGVSVAVFTKTISERLVTLSRLVKNKHSNYSEIIDEIYARRLDHQHGWTAGISRRRHKLRNGHERNSFTEFGQPNLRGERLTQLWNDLSAIDWDRQRTLQSSNTVTTLGSGKIVNMRNLRSVCNQLGFERTIKPLESKSTIENRQLEQQGLDILRKRETRIHSQLRRSDPFHDTL